MNTWFSMAQDAANAAYDMTLEMGGSADKASDDYRSVMQAYIDAQDDVERGAGCAGNSADAYDSSTEGHW